jgi:hypothetical protein
MDTQQLIERILQACILFFSVYSVAVYASNSWCNASLLSETRDTRRDCHHPIGFKGQRKKAVVAQEVAPRFGRYLD